MISSENVHCSSASVVPSCLFSGPVNRVQVYCGLEIAIMAMTPSKSCIQRFESDVVLSLETAAVMDLTPPENPTCPAGRSRSNKTGPLLFEPRSFQISPAAIKPAVCDAHR